MKHPTIIPLAQKATLIVGVVSLLLLEAPGWGRADALPDFTGYTRPGVPSGQAAVKDGQITFVADNGAKNDGVLGGTVYFTVIDTALDTEENDIWRKMSPEMIKAFVPGKESRGGSSPVFDTHARYVYLYQTVNDMPNAKDAMRTASVFLTDPSLLTSWGHFAGHGFSALVEKDDKSVIRPVSFSNAIGDERQYREYDDYHLTDNLLQIGQFPSRSKDQDIVPAAADDPVRNPSRVVLMGGPDYANRGYPWYGWRGLFPQPPLAARRPAARADRADDRPRDRELRNDEPQLRTIWNENNLLKPKERGALFGFTSDFPPIYDDVQLRGRPVAKTGGAIRPAVGQGPGAEDKDVKLAADEKAKKDKDVRPAAAEPVDKDGAVKPAAAPGTATGTGAAPAGQVPTPAGGGAGGAVGGAGGLMGGMPLGGGAGGGAPLGGGGLGGGAPLGGGSGGGPSGGTTGGIPATTTATTPTQLVPETVAQLQPQQQGQNQSQTQSGGQGPSSSSSSSSSSGGIVPEPPAWVLVAVGLPCLVLLLRSTRRKGAAPVLP